MSRRIECRSEGCTSEVLFKSLDGAFDDRRGSGGRPSLSPTERNSPSGLHHRHSNGSIQVSPYCKQHTCIHFHGDERCIYKKPPHDTVCPIHARCPVANCTQARAQFLEPNFDPMSNTLPRYARFDVCSEHQCKARSCRTIVEGSFPYCASRRPAPTQNLSFKGDNQTSQTSSARQPAAARQNTTLQRRAIISATARCQNLRDWMPESENCGRFCPLHTCRVDQCRKHVDSLSIFCLAHFKEHYITQGKQ
ncbi:hypothetical protein N658DRAFT_412287, partial [Parathielavia hyrcaniae]